MIHPLIQPPSLTKEQTNAIKAVAAGVGNKRQQQLAVATIVNDLARTHDLAWDPDNQHLSSYSAGRRSVGLAILKEINIHVQD